MGMLRGMLVMCVRVIYKRAQHCNGIAGLELGVADAMLIKVRAGLHSCATPWLAVTPLVSSRIYSGIVVAGMCAAASGCVV
jgi:hypothetical protein